MDPECAQLGRSCAEIVADYVLVLLPGKLTPEATRTALVRLGAAVARVSARQNRQIDALAAEIERRVAGRLEEAAEARARALFTEYAEQLRETIVQELRSAAGAQNGADAQNLKNAADRIDRLAGDLATRVQEHQDEQSSKND